MPDSDAEIERLRRDLAQAQAAVREAEAEVGELRGTIAELKTQLARARQDQESFQLMLDAKRRANERFTSVRARIRGWLRSALR